MKGSSLSSDRANANMLAGRPGCFLSETSALFLTASLNQYPPRDSPADARTTNLTFVISFRRPDPLRSPEEPNAEPHGPGSSLIMRRDEMKRNVASTAPLMSSPSTNSSLRRMKSWDDAVGSVAALRTGWEGG